MINRLVSATSPYLRQHADNPVGWYPWGPEAFAEARRRDVPVMVSIGYSTCHWCHVMARESFSHPEIAALINEHVVAIKVDREELPAVDSYYMNALQAFRGQGGWPLTAFTDHEGVPFFSGTYYPPTPRGNLPSLPQVVSAVAKTWRDERGQVDRIAEQLGGRLRELADLGQAVGMPDGEEDGRAVPDGEAAAGRGAGGIAPPDLDELRACVETLESRADFNHGGFGAAPKFPPFNALRFLVRFAWVGRGDAASGAEPAAGTALGIPDPGALTLARRTFLSLATGGIRDHLRGGLFRYSVDAAWRVPHFEKMLGDNAMYLEALTDWCRLEVRLDPGSPWTALAAGEAAATGEFILRDMRVELASGASAGGASSGAGSDASAEAGTGGAGANAERPAPCGFATALDADSETFDPHSGLGSVHREGAFYTFTADEFSQALHASGVQPEESSLRLFAGDHTDDLPGGVLLREAAEFDPRAESSGAADARLLERLRTYQDSRPAPARDDKFVVELNGLAVAALFRAGRVFGRADFTEAAADGLRLLHRLPLASEGSLPRSVSVDAAGPGAGLAVGPGAAGIVDLLALIRAELAADASAVRGDGTDWQRVNQLWQTVLNDFVVLPGAGAEGTGNGLKVYDTLPEPLLDVRHADPIDQVTPSGRSALAEIALLLRELAPVESSESSPDGSAIAVPDTLLETVLSQGIPLMREAPTGAGYLAYAAALAVDPVRVETGSAELLRLAAVHPATVALAAGHDLGSQAQVCRGNVCGLPVTAPQALADRLDEPAVKSDTA